MNQPTSAEPAAPCQQGKPLRYGSVCSGMEAASVAWHPLGWTPAFFSEIEPFPCAILKHRFPNTPNHGSLTEYQSWPVEPGAIDLLVGGTPCQSFSVAGLRKGLEDPRGNLALVFLGLADKLKPRWIVWENVPGVLSSAGGRDFGSFLGALVELGYGFAYRVLDAQHFRGTPQRRRRVFVVACRNPVTGLGDWRAPAEVLLESDCVRRDSKKGRAKGQGVASGSEGGVGADHPEGCWWDGGQVSQTLDAVLQKGQTMPEKNRFPAVLQPATPYRKSKRACSTTDDETQVPADASNTLNNFDLGDTRTTHAVVEAEALVAFPILDNQSFVHKGINHASTQEANAREILSSLQSQVGEEAFAQWGSGILDSLQRKEVLRSFVYGKRVRLAASEAGLELVNCTPSCQESLPSGAMLRLWEEGPDGRSPQGRELAKQLANQFGKTVPELPHQSPPAMAVRRLTPIETERLQGFPDNWSRIPWKGKPEEQCPDGPRYKACGNSMAVPVMRWIGARIAEVDAKYFPNHEAK